MGIGSQDSVEMTGRATSGSLLGKQGLVMLLGLAAGILALLGVLAVLGDGDPEGAGGGQPGMAEGDGPRPTLAGFFTTTSTTAATTTAAPTTAPPTTMSPGEFLLGEPTGLWLFYGGADPLQRLDLDTGELIEFGLQASPILATDRGGGGDAGGDAGGDIVLYQGASGVVGWVSSENPAEQALNWKDGPVAPGPVPGTLWILDRSEDGEHPSGLAVGSGRWELFDTDANRVIERRPGDLYPDVLTAHAESMELGGRFEALHPGPDFTTRADGVYAYGDDAYRRIGDGRILTYDDSLVLLAECPEAAGSGDGCRHRWIDRASGDPVDQPTPGSASVVFAELLGGGRWLHTIDDRERSELVDLSTGIRLELDRSAHLTVSPDGRWLAYLAGKSLIVSDLAGDLGKSFEYRDLSLDGGGDLLFVERPASAG